MQDSKSYSLFRTGRKGQKALLCRFVAVVFCCSPCFAAPTFTDQTTALTGGGLSGWRAAWGDYDADGFVDILYGGNLFRNNGPDPITSNWSFTGVFSAGPQGVWGDYDNDGDLDIYSWESQQMLRYDGGTTFTQVSVPVISGTRYGAAWGDWNNDSYLDLYVAGGGGSNQPNAVLQGSVNGTFTTAWTTGANNSRAVTSTDVDRDGYQDVYVSNYWQPNKFYENPGVIGGREWPIAGRGLQESPTGYTSGSSFGDFDNDGYMDAVTGNLDHGPQHSSSVYQNMGPSGSYQFTERFAFTGSDYQEAYNSPSLGDYDNDGDLDVLMTVWQNYGGAARLYRNDGNWNFTNVTAAEGLATNMGTSGGNEGAAWADFDNDGDLDLLAGDRIWTNAGNNNHWLKVKLTGDGTTVNKAAIGSSVRVSVAGKTMTRQVEGGTGVGYQNDLTLHFGLGSHSGPVDLEISPPGVGSWTVQGVAVDQTVAYEVKGPEPPLFYDNLESYPLGVSLAGQDEWVMPLNGGNGAVSATVVSGGPAGTQGISGGSEGNFGGGAVLFDPVSTGVVELSMDWFGPQRHEFRIEGDGQEGQGANFFRFIDYQVYWDLGYEAIYYVEGNDVEDSEWRLGSNAPLSSYGWRQLQVEMDFDNNTMSVDWIDIDDALGTPVAGVGGNVWSGGLPFTSFNWFEAVSNWVGPSYPVQFDNLELLHTDAPCDFNGDMLCRVVDIRMMMNQGDLVAGVSVGAGNQFDLNSDNTINEADITEWLDLTGTHNGYGSPMLRGDTDGLGNMSPTPRTVDITDFQNFLNDFTGSCVNWECGNFNGDNVVDITDFSNHFLPSFSATDGGTYGLEQSVPEPGTVVLLGLGGVLLTYFYCCKPRK